MKTKSVLKRNWAKIKRYLQLRYPWLTAEDLNYTEVYENELFYDLQIKTGNTRKQLLEEFNVILLQR